MLALATDAVVRAHPPESRPAGARRGADRVPARSSSTGHLAVAERLLGIGRTPAEKRAADAYAIVIQGGAILAVLLVSLGRIRSMIRGLFGRDRDGLRLLANLAIAFVPAAVVGLLLEPVRDRLFGIWPIVGAWIVGGLLILLLVRERSAGVRAGAGSARRGRESPGVPDLARVARDRTRPGGGHLARRRAEAWSTIAAALLLGLSVPAAVEFSFLLGLITLGAATGYEAGEIGRGDRDRIRRRHPGRRVRRGRGLGLRGGPMDGFLAENAQPVRVRVVPDRHRRVVAALASSGS